MAVDAVGAGAAGATNGAMALRPMIPNGRLTTPGAQVGTIPTRIGAAPLGAGEIHSERSAH